MVRVEYLRLLEPRKYSPLQAAMDAFLLSKEAARCTPKTMEHYTYIIGVFLDFLQSIGVISPQQITPDHIRRHLVNLQRQGLKDTTQHAHARGIKAWLNRLVTEEELDVSPMRRVTMPRLEKRVRPPFNPDDVHKLLAACDRRPSLGLRNYAIVLGLLDTGLRLAEFASLSVGDVNIRSGLTIAMGKGRKVRTVRFGAKARGALARWLAARGDVDPGDSLWGLKPRGLQIMVWRLGRKAGVEPCGPHRFRRTFALWCLRDGLPLFETAHGAQQSCRSVEIPSLGW